MPGQIKIFSSLDYGCTVKFNPTISSLTETTCGVSQLFLTGLSQIFATDLKLTGTLV